MDVERTELRQVMDELRKVNVLCWHDYCNVSTGNTGKIVFVFIGMEHCCPDRSLRSKGDDDNDSQLASAGLPMEEISQVPIFHPDKLYLTGAVRDKVFCSPVVSAGPNPQCNHKIYFSN